MRTSTLRDIPHVATISTDAESISTLGMYDHAIPTDRALDELLAPDKIGVPSKVVANNGSMKTGRTANSTGLQNRSSTSKKSTRNAGSDTYNKTHRVGAKTSSRSNATNQNNDDKQNRQKRKGHKPKKEFQRPPHLQLALDRLQERRLHEGPSCPRLQSAMDRILAIDKMQQGHGHEDHSEGPSIANFILNKETMNVENLRELLNIFEQYESIVDHLVKKHARLKGYVEHNAKDFPQNFRCTTEEVKGQLQRLRTKYTYRDSKPGKVTSHEGESLDGVCGRNLVRSKMVTVPEGTGQKTRLGDDELELETAKQKNLIPTREMLRPPITTDNATKVVINPPRLPSPRRTNKLDRKQVKFSNTDGADQAKIGDVNRKGASIRLQKLKEQKQLLAERVAVERLRTSLAEGRKASPRGHCSSHPQRRVEFQAHETEKREIGTHSQFIGAAESSKESDQVHPTYERPNRIWQLRRELAHLRNVSREHRLNAAKQSYQQRYRKEPIETQEVRCFTPPRIRPGHFAGPDPIGRSSDALIAQTIDPDTSKGSLLDALEQKARSQEERNDQDYPMIPSPPSLRRRLQPPDSEQIGGKYGEASSASRQPFVGSSHHNSDSGEEFDPEMLWAKQTPSQRWKFFMSEVASDFGINPLSSKSASQGGSFLEANLLKLPSLLSKRNITIFEKKKNAVDHQISVPCSSSSEDEYSTSGSEADTSGEWEPERRKREPPARRTFSKYQTTCDTDSSEEREELRKTRKRAEYSSSTSTKQARSHPLKLVPCQDPASRDRSMILSHLLPEESPKEFRALPPVTYPRKPSTASVNNAPDGKAQGRFLPVMPSNEEVALFRETKEVEEDSESETPSEQARQLLDQIGLVQSYSQEIRAQQDQIREEMTQIRHRHQDSFDEVNKRALQNRNIGDDGEHEIMELLLQEDYGDDGQDIQMVESGDGIFHLSLSKDDPVIEEAVIHLDRSIGYDVDNDGDESGESASSTAQLWDEASRRHHEHVRQQHFLQPSSSFKSQTQVTIDVSALIDNDDSQASYDGASMAWNMKQQRAPYQSRSHFTTGWQPEGMDDNERTAFRQMPNLVSSESSTSTFKETSHLALSILDDDNDDDEYDEHEDYDPMYDMPNSPMYDMPNSPTREDQGRKLATQKKLQEQPGNFSVFHHDATNDTTLKAPRGAAIARSHNDSLCTNPFNIF